MAWFRSTRAASSAGARPKIRVLAKLASSVNASARQSTAIAFGGILSKRIHRGEDPDSGISDQNTAPAAPSAVITRAFDQQLANDAAPARTERRPDGHFPPALSVRPNSRLPTLAQTISRTNPSAAAESQRDARTLRVLSCLQLR